MSTTEHDIASFTNFALQKIEAGESDLSIDELFDQWRIENPWDELYAENVAAVQSSIEDFKAGDWSISGGAGMKPSLWRDSLSDAPRQA